MKFVKNQPSLLIEKKKILVITDLHIGIEYELYKAGINIPSQINEMKKTIEELIGQTKAKRLVILGDIKHKVPGISYQEEREIPRFLEELSGMIRLSICRGNHDDNLNLLVPDIVELHGTTGFKIEKYGFNHGHTYPDKQLLACDYLIMGHTHPTIQFTDKFGYRIIEPIWIKGKIDQEKIKERYRVNKTGKLEVIIMPAFNRFLGGAPVNIKKTNDELLGPLLKNNFVDMDNVELYLLDGTYLGKLKSIL